MTLHRTIRTALLAAVGGALVVGSGVFCPAGAELVRGAEAVPAADARAVFELVKIAFEQGDQQILADLVHGDGLLVRAGGAGGRDTEYSPSQAFYYFKNLFQSHQTVGFTFLRMEETSVGERVHALAQWTHRRPNREGDQEMRLVFVLNRQGQTWRLTEITTIG